uniref:Cytochrome c biogenesis protein Ccs1 n=1 Tax=Rhodomonas salina TaxID=3034 RepID=CCS1_RHOSW|nr:c-type cytochrome biogenensis protein [Rhodomonas salina]A6MVS2.1 RecName: Full=Cytochrome c biogenesis protein Ccs1 [Rhodomonas salina]ABO70849.1 cytochrome c biogenesis protein [Rhodomonas salina]
MLIKINQYFRKSISVLGNLKLAIILLLMLALFSAFGTVIEQNQNVAFYENSYPNSAPLFGFLSANAILFLGLNNIYQTWWFTTLILLLAVSLFSCTLARQIPSLKMARLWQFYTKDQSLKKIGLSFNLQKTSLSKLAFTLKTDDYNVIQKGRFLYAYKGLPGKIGPIIVHASLIIILFGALLGNLSGFVSQELVPLGGVFHIQNIINSGTLSYVPQNFEGYVKDFKIAYNDEGSIDQFYSDLSILNSTGEEVRSKTIYVNEPLRYEGIVFYQTDWSITNLAINVDQQTNIQLPLKSINVKGEGKFWIASLPIANVEKATNDNILLVLEDLTGKILLYSSNQQLLAIVNVGENISLNGHSVKVTDIISSTGLQIKSDPGIPFVYIGFFLLMLSITLSYFSYSQVWAIKDNKTLYVSGRTNRAIYSFEQQITKMMNKLNSTYA